MERNINKNIDNSKELVETNIRKNAVQAYINRKTNRKSENQKKNVNKSVKLRKDCTGNRYGSIVVEKMIYGEKGNGKKPRTKCLCRCDCGNIKIFESYRVRKGLVTSCGCIPKKRGPAHNRKDLTGQRFGKLVVLEMIREENGKRLKRTKCRCVCDCGNEKVAWMSDIQNGSTRSCGCITQVPKNEDLTGNVFGNLTAIKRVEDKVSKSGHKTTMWECVCECGKVVTVAARRLKSGRTKSCGCLSSRETIGERSAKDYTGFVSDSGVRFIKPSGISRNNSRVWECECGLCGQRFYSKADLVVSGHRKSCGCLSKSYGEAAIEKLLHEKGVKYKTQFAFPDCKYKAPLRFDFAVFDKHSKLSFLIEYDGMQHYVDIDYFGGSDEFELRKRRDKIKDDYCRNNNIDLLRIPYTLSMKDMRDIIIEKLN